MAKTKRGKKRARGLNYLPLVLAGAVFLFLAGVVIGGELGIKALPTTAQIKEAATTFFDQILPDGSKPIIPPLPGGEVRVHAIDVGQGNSYLIQTANSTVLIDAGENDKGEAVIDYLKSVGVKKLDIAIGTHPHSDHIGGLDYVIDHVPVDKVILPKVADKMVPTTKTYRDLLQVIADRGLKVTAAKPGTQYDLGGGAMLTLLGPVGSNYQDLNDYSVVCRLDYGESSFLFCGDCSKPGENDLLESGAKLNADVYFVPHHGSSTASQDKYLKAVRPLASVISLGAGNSYGHPHKEVVERLAAYGPIYRTDLQGSITVFTDGKKITIQTQRGDTSPLVVKGVRNESDS